MHCRWRFESQDVLRFGGHEDGILTELPLRHMLYGMKHVEGKPVKVYGYLEMFVPKDKQYLQHLLPGMWIPVRFMSHARYIDMNNELCMAIGRDQPLHHVGFSYWVDSLYRAHAVKRAKRVIDKCKKK